MDPTKNLTSISLKDACGEKIGLLFFNPLSPFHQNIGLGYVFLDPSKKFLKSIPYTRKDGPGKKRRTSLAGVRPGPDNARGFDTEKNMQCHAKS